MAQGTPAPAALAFLLAAPAINPVVLVATAVAFPGRRGRPRQFLASLAAAIAVGLLWRAAAAMTWLAGPGRTRTTITPTTTRRWPCWWRPPSTTCSTPAGS